MAKGGIPENRLESITIETHTPSLEGISRSPRNTL